MSPRDTDEFEGELEQSRAETRAAFENRALMYAYFYEELADELGPDRATELMKRAIHRRGLEVGRAYRAAAHAGDLEAVGQIFCDGSPSAGELFTPAVEEEGEERIVLSMSSCPLVDAWRGAGLDPEEIEHMCSIAAAVDEGTFEGAGLELTFLDRIGCVGSERCLLELRLPAGR
jgi:predicted ArsR family transcriptional regulator